MRALMKWVIFFLLLWSFEAFPWNISDVFEGLSTNVTSPGSYQDQAAGYLSLGGCSIRSRPKDLQPLALSEPRIKMGNCGNLDMHFGSLSMVTGDELVSLMKKIGSDAKAYAMQLAIKTFAPQIENLLKDLRNLAHQLNGVALNSCEMTQSLFASALPKDLAMRRQVCADLGRGSEGVDWFKARETCRDDEKALQQTNAHQLRHPNLLVGDYNLLLKAAEKAKIPSDVATPLLNLLGTIIMKEGEAIYLEGLVKDDETWETYLRGGKNASFYACEDGPCLQVTLKRNKEIPPDQSLSGMATKKLRTLKTKMLMNQAFSEEEIQFLSSIGEALPLYHYLSLEVVSGEHILDKSATIVATYILIQYVQKIIQEVRAGLSLLKAKQINDEHMVRYMKALDQVQSLLSKKYQTWVLVVQNMEKIAAHIEAHQLSKMRF